jgi:hypothetical protein
MAGPVPYAARSRRPGQCHGWAGVGRCLVPQVGQLGVLSFGAQVDLLHPLDMPFTVRHWPGTGSTPSTCRSPYGTGPALAPPPRRAVHRTALARHWLHPLDVPFIPGLKVLEFKQYSGTGTGPALALARHWPLLVLGQCRAAVISAADLTRLVAAAD